MNVGERIKARRLLLNLTQQELADRMGYKSKQAITKIEKGDNDISQSNVVKFAQVLQCTPADLMGWNDDENENILVGTEWAELIKKYSLLNDGEKKAVNNLIDSLISMNHSLDES